jgi:multidrug efflux pump subunit AcrB
VLARERRGRKSGASPNGASQAYGNPGAASNGTQLLSNLVSVRRSYMPVIVNHYNVWPVFDIYANVDRRDLGGVGAEVRRIMREEEPHLPRGTSFDLRGQVETMQSSFFRLGLGMIFAVALVYLLMTVNFQSWLDPFIILMALPRRLGRILWILFLTGTTLSVPSLMGSIMCVGVWRPRTAFWSSPLPTISAPRYFPRTKPCWRPGTRESGRC